MVYNDKTEMLYPFLLKLNPLSPYPLQKSNLEGHTSEVIVKFNFLTRFLPYQKQSPCVLLDVPHQLVSSSGYECRKMSGIRS